MTGLISEGVIPAKPVLDADRGVEKWCMDVPSSQSLPRTPIRGTEIQFFILPYQGDI